MILIHPIHSKMTVLITPRNRLYKNILTLFLEPIHLKKLYHLMNSPNKTGATPVNYAIRNFNPIILKQIMSKASFKQLKHRFFINIHDLLKQS